MFNVSVIIPNYNYAKFLPRRISCIINQTIKPSEIIFLDDCSTDNSLIVAEEVLSKSDIPYRIVTNQVNQGVFKQWLKGIELSSYDYFWIAEADDYCELNFLESLLPAFVDIDVVISYCKSKFVDLEGRDICDENDYKIKYFDISHWGNSYVNTQDDEIENYLSVINTIPNASAVLFNKSRINYPMIFGEINKYQKAGDWLFYILALSSNHNNKISYSSMLLNNYVRHDHSVYTSNYTKPELFTELLNIYSYILRNYNLSTQTKESIFNHIYELAVWYDYTNSNYDLLITLQNYLEGLNFFEKSINEGKKLINDISRKEKHICILNKELFRVNNEWGNLNKELSHVSKELFRVNNEWGNLNKELSHVSKELFRVNNEWGNLDRELSLVSNKLDDTEKKLVQSNEALNEKIAELNGLLNSFSWKLTSPLRKIIKLFKRKKSKAT